MKTTFNHFIPKEKEGSYYTIPFPMPANIDTAIISYSYENGRIDLGIQEGEQFLGWTGSAKETIRIGNNPEKGYTRTVLTEGTYYIMVGAYKVADEGVDVTYEIEYIPKKAKWLSGDLHMHTNASDGQYDSYTIAHKAKDMGLDFISITDHNNFSENFHLPNVSGLTIIPGVEWTHYKGHMNFYGVKDPFTNCQLNTEEEMQELIASVKKRGAIVSVNHPKDKNCGFLWKSHNYDLFEVWNGPMRPANTKALAMWHSLLKRGKRVPIIGGSDFHRSMHPVMLGHPITRVYAMSNSVEDIMEAILAGKSYVTSSMNGPAIDMEYKDGELHISVENAKGCKVHLITQDGKVATFKQKKVFVVDPSWKFAYVVVKGVWIKAISNPIYFD